MAITVQIWMAVDNHDISKYLDMGLDDIYEVRIQRISPDAHPENQIEVIVYIKNQNKE